MANATYPLAVPDDLVREVRAAAKDTGLTMAEAMRQSIRLGLPRLREALAAGRVTNVDPLPDKIARKLYSQPEDDTEGIKLFMAAQSSDEE
jgi:hypothetical protein